MKRLDFWATIALSDVTLYVTSAAEDTMRTVIATPRRFRPCLIIGEFSARFQAYNIAAEIPSSVNLTLANTDGWLDDFLGFGPHARIWDNREVTIKYGGVSGSAFETMATEFTGRIRRGTLRHTQEAVTFEVYDIRQAQDKNILQFTFDADAYPNAASGVNGQYIPVIYGDFTIEGAPPAVPFGGGRLPAFCTDVTAAQFPFRVAVHGITFPATDAVYQFDASADTWLLLVAGAGNDYVTTADGFVLTAARSAATDIEADVFTVNCKGKTPGTLIVAESDSEYQFAINIMADLLVYFGGAVAGDIDTAAWVAAHAAGDAHLNRRWIGSQTTVMQAIGEIAFENNYLFFTSPTKYELSFNLPKSAITVNVRDAQPIEDSVQSVYDPDSVYANRAISVYDLDVSEGGGEYRGSVELNNVTAQTEYGETILTGFAFAWLYVKSNVRLQTDRKLLVLSSKAHYVDFGVHASDPTAPFWRLTLAETLTLSRWQYLDTPLQIRELRRDAESGRIFVRALAIQDAFQVCQWANTPINLQVTFPAKWNDPAITQTPAGRWF